MMTPSAVLVGPPAAGKSTIGCQLAQRLAVPFRDIDADIVASTGRTIVDIFANDGEPVFRALEEQAVAAALVEYDGVLSLGGGAVLSERTRQRLRGHRVVFLNVGVNEGMRRSGLSTARPLLAGVNPRATFKALLEARLPLYREVAAVEVVTDHRALGDVLAEVLDALAKGSGQ